MILLYTTVGIEITPTSACSTAVSGSTRFFSLLFVFLSFWLFKCLLKEPFLYLFVSVFSFYKDKNAGHHSFPSLLSYPKMTSAHQVL